MEIGILYALVGEILTKEDAVDVGVFVAFVGCVMTYL